MFGWVYMIEMGFPWGSRQINIKKRKFELFSRERKTKLNVICFQMY